MTHDAEVARHADRVIRIADGQIVDDASVHAAWPGRRRRRPRRRRAAAVAAAPRAARPAGGGRAPCGSRCQALRRNVMRTVL